MKKFLYLILCLTLVALVIATYFGMVPGLSDALGRGVKNLDVTASREALSALESRAGIDFISATELPDGATIAFHGSKPVTGSYTSEEITSIFAEAPWKDFPLTNTQIKINPEGKVAIAARLHPNRIPAYLAAHGVKPSPGDEIIINKVDSLAGVSMPVYVSFDAEWNNNSLTTFTPHEASIGAFQATDGQRTEYVGMARLAITALVHSVPGLTIEHLDFKGGTMNVSGTFPEKIEVVGN